jgi:diketogulonate reductase-like aldo/keto reductase
MNLTSTIKLNNGVEIPRLGLGVFRVPDGDSTADSVRWALECGYRHIDTAAVYENETGVGRGMRESGINRSEIFLTTKVWNDDMRANNVRDAFKKSLSLLDTDYVDLYLIHWPVAGKYIDSYKVLEELYAEGRVKAIGVSNFQKRHLDDLLSATKIIPAVNQIERHPWLTQEPLISYCRNLGIEIEAWSPLGGTGGSLLQEETLKEIAAKYGKTPAQIIIRWDLQQNVIVMPKSTHKDRIRQNSDVYDFELSTEDSSLLDNINMNKRTGADPDTFTF